MHTMQAASGKLACCPVQHLPYLLQAARSRGLDPWRSALLSAMHAHHAAC